MKYYLFFFCGEIIIEKQGDKKQVLEVIKNVLILKKIPDTIGVKTFSLMNFILCETNFGFVIFINIF